MRCDLAQLARWFRGGPVAAASAATATALLLLLVLLLMMMPLLELLMPWAKARDSQRWILALPRHLLACFQRRPSLAHRFYLSLGAPVYGMRLNKGRGRSCLSYQRCQCQSTFLRVDGRWAPRKSRVGAQHRKLPRCSTCV